MPRSIVRAARRQPTRRAVSAIRGSDRARRAAPSRADRRSGGSRAGSSRRRRTRPGRGSAKANEPPAPGCPNARSLEPKRKGPCGRTNPSENAVSTFSTSSCQPCGRRRGRPRELLERGRRTGRAPAAAPRTPRRRVRCHARRPPLRPRGTRAARYLLTSRWAGERRRGLANVRKLSERGLSIAAAIAGGRWRSWGSTFTSETRSIAGELARGTDLVRHAEVDLRAPAAPRSPRRRSAPACGRSGSRRRISSPSYQPRLTPW